MKIRRRLFSKLLLATNTTGLLIPSTNLFAQNGSLTRAAIEVESRQGARLGLSVRDVASGQTWNYHADQRFPMCSTLKVLAAAAFLVRVDRGED